MCRTKVPQFQATYEKLVENGAIPRSATFMNIDDQEGNQLWRIVVMSNMMENYMQEGRKQGLTLRKFVYDYEKYKADQEVRTKLEQRQEFLKVSPIQRFISFRINLLAEAISPSVNCLLLWCIWK